MTETPYVRDAAREAKSAPPAGLIADLADWIESAMERPQREFAVAASLAFWASICGRSHNIAGTGLNLYFALLAPTAHGIDVKPVLERLYASLRPHEIAIDDRIATSEITTSILASSDWPSNNWLCVMSDWAAVLTTMARFAATDRTRSLRRVLIDLFRHSGRDAAVTIGQTRHKSPAISILAQNSDEEYWDGMTESLLTGGLMSRFLHIEPCAASRPPLNAAAATSPPPALLSAISRVASTAESLASADRHGVEVGVSVEANTILMSFAAYADARLDADRAPTRIVWTDVLAKARRLAGIIAVARNAARPLIDAEIAQWAADYVWEETESVLAHYSADGQAHRLREEIQDDTLRRYFAEWTSRPWSQIKAYYPKHEILHQEKICPQHFLQKKIHNIAAFSRDPRGRAVAFRESIQRLCDRGEIRRTRPETLKRRYGVHCLSFYVEQLATHTVARKGTPRGTGRPQRT